MEKSNIGPIRSGTKNRKPNGPWIPGQVLLYLAWTLANFRRKFPTSDYLDLKAVLISPPFNPSRSELILKKSFAMKILEPRIIKFLCMRDANIFSRAGSRISIPFKWRKPWFYQDFLAYHFYTVFDQKSKNVFGPKSQSKNGLTCSWKDR